MNGKATQRAAAIFGLLLGWGVASPASAAPSPDESAAQRTTSETPGASRAPHVTPESVPGDPLNLRLHTGALVGVGGQLFLGADAQLLGDVVAWSSRRALGSVGGGVAFVYHDEPTFLAPWIDRDQVKGAARRFQLLAAIGHTVHFGKRRRSSLDTHLFFGWSHWRSAYTVDYAGEDLHGSSSISRNHAIVGGQVRYTYRVARRVGLHAQLSAPIPTRSSYAITYGSAGVGLTFYLR